MRCLSPIHQLDAVGRGGRWGEGGYIFVDLRGRSSVSVLPKFLTSPRKMFGCTREAAAQPTQYQFGSAARFIVKGDETVGLDLLDYLLLYI